MLKSQIHNNRKDYFGQQEEHYSDLPFYQRIFSHGLLTRERENSLAEKMSDSLLKYGGLIMHSGAATLRILPYLINSAKIESWNKTMTFFLNPPKMNGKLEKTKERIRNLVGKNRAIIESADSFNKKMVTALKENIDEYSGIILGWKPRIRILEEQFGGNSSFRGLKESAGLYEKLKASYNSGSILYRDFLRESKKIALEEIIFPEKLLEIAAEEAGLNQDYYATRNEFMEYNHKFVAKFAVRYWSSIKNNQKVLSFDDIFQLGQIGVMKAAERFDPKFGFKFSTYSKWWINQTIKRGIQRFYSAIKLPAHGVISEIKKAEERIIRREESTDIDIHDLALESGISEKKLKILWPMVKIKFISLDERFGGDFETSRDYHDIIQDTEQLLPSIEAEKRNTKEKIDYLLTLLSKKERKILEMRFGLGSDNPLTLEEVGNKFNLTRERIRQIQNKALIKLRHPTRLKYIL